MTILKIFVRSPGGSFDLFVVFLIFLIPGGSNQEKDVIPDPQLLHKLAQLSSPTLPLQDSMGDASQEILYIIDFFLAMALCNTVVVSSPGLLRRTAVSPHPPPPSRDLGDFPFQTIIPPRFWVTAHNSD